MWIKSEDGQLINTDTAAFIKFYSTTNTPGTFSVYLNNDVEDLIFISEGNKVSEIWNAIKEGNTYLDLST